MKRWSRSRFSRRRWHAHAPKSHTSRTPKDQNSDGQHSRTKYDTSKPFRRAAPTSRAGSVDLHCSRRAVNKECGQSMATNTGEGGAHSASSAEVSGAAQKRSTILIQKRRGQRRQENVPSVRVGLKQSTAWIAQSTTTRRTQCDQRCTSPTKRQLSGEKLQVA